MSTTHIIVAAALLPAVILMIIIMVRDRKHPEPIPLLIKGLFFGVLSAFASFLISGPTLALGLVPATYSNGIQATLHSFGVAAIPEETAKLFFLWLLLRKNAYFDEYLDGIVYAVCIGLGFAAFENVGYLFSAGEEWQVVAISRALLAVPAHFFFAVIMGYYYSLMHFGHHVKRNRIMMWAVPVLAHGIYDAIAMSTDVSPGYEWLFMVALLLFVNELRKLCTRHIQELLDADNNSYNKNPNS